MTITVGDLVDNIHLKAEVIAGSDGLNREVNWAHSCDLEDPTYWLTEGVLFMTNGLTIPEDEGGQISYLQRIINSEASGLAVGKGLHAPELTAGLIDLANQYHFPILLVDYDVPWIAFSKMVATSNVMEEQKKVVKTMRLYDLVSKSIHHTSPEKIIEMISCIIECRICIIDLNNSLPLFNMDIEKSLIDHFKTLSVNNAPLAINTFKWSEKTVVNISLSTTRPLSMFAISSTTKTPDDVILKHIATILGLVIEVDTTILERQRRMGSEIFIRMLEGVITDQMVSLLLHEHDFEEKPVVLAAIEKHSFKHDWLHLWLRDLSIPHLITERENSLLILLPNQSEVISALKNVLPKNLQIGISNSISKRFTRVPKAYEEAIWALQSAISQKKRIAFYSQELPTSIFVPNNIENATEIVERVLGSLLNYDTANNGQLVETLYEYLSETRSWKKTAEKLHIHKQSLVYRINRIEEITGKPLNDMNHISEFWIALRIAIMLEIIPDYGKKNKGAI